MKTLEQYQYKTCVILVSGGPDSIALAHMAVSSHLNVHLVSVNYHQRESSYKDIELVKAFAKTHLCEVHIFDAPELKGNFQAKARDFRYSKAIEVAHRVRAEVIMSAHHLDDHIETYLWQIKRNHHPLYFGIKPSTWLEEFELVRPCLSLSKKDLVDYNHQYGLDYIIDESNASLKYTRNAIRKSIEAMGEIEKKHILQQIDDANDVLMRKRDELSQHINHDSIDVEWFKTLSKEDMHLCLRLFLNQHRAIKASSDALNQVLQHLDHKDYHQFFAPGYLLVHRGLIRFFKPLKPLNVVIDSFDTWTASDIQSFDKPLKELNVQLYEHDFPLILRFAKARDRMQIKIGRKKVFNWFSEKKIPRIERQFWPVIENAEKQIIYVKGWGAELVHRTNKNT